ncbi:MAG: NUDIX hydrolase [Acidimicrobiales bacterium]
MSADGPYLPPVSEDGLRHWQVAGGVIVSGDDRVLLVKNQRKGGLIDWSTPGGVVDPGESALVGLTREVEEETGLRVLQWQGPLYRVEVHAPDAGFFLRVEAHLGVAVEGEIHIDDPDGIVVAADYVHRTGVRNRLGTAQPWVTEPLLAHIEDGVDDGRVFRYRMTGATRQDRTIERL